MEPTRLQEKIADAAQLMKALSNQHRLAILCQLALGEKSVGELVALIGLSQSALSQHLARLRRDRLVRTRRSAQTIYYTLDGVQARVLLDTLHELYCRDDDATERVLAPRGRPSTDAEIRPPAGSTA